MKRKALGQIVLYCGVAVFAIVIGISMSNSQNSDYAQRRAEVAIWAAGYRNNTALQEAVKCDARTPACGMNSEYVIYFTTEVGGKIRKGYVLTNKLTLEAGTPVLLPKP